VPDPGDSHRQASGEAAKRPFDILVAGAGLCVFLPVLALLALLVLMTDGPPLLYREERVGRHGKLFPQYKFRTLKPGTSGERSVAPEDDPRITGVGLWLRRWRLDEFPQLVNVLCGHMSLVGPRPMPPSHAAALPPDQLQTLLSVRPGLTDPAAIRFLAEDAVLAGLDDPEAVYLARFLPAKARMQVDSLAHRSFAGDLHILADTLALLWSPSARRESARDMRDLL
jgi:lipopolysaccharide/colanic/teichoic acid biosynthesis glycosyltransferase